MKLPRLPAANFAQPSFIPDSGSEKAARLLTAASAFLHSLAGKFLAASRQNCQIQ